MRISFCGGIVFGIGWLVFIDSLAHFNACIDSVELEDVCRWGPAPTNGTLYPKPVLPGTPSPTPSPWNPFNPPTPTPAPVIMHKGWQSIHGSFKWVYVPGALAMVGLFMINTVDVKHLSHEYSDMAHGASPAALRLWLMAGLMVGLGAMIQSIYLYVNLFARYVDVHSAPGLAAMIQTALIAIGSLVFWIGRSSAADDSWGTDPLL